MKTYRLFKRDSAGREMSPDAEGFRDRPWHFKFEYKGKVYPRVLETNDADKAQQRAKKIVDTIKTAIIREQSAPIEATKTRHARVSTLGEIFAIYRKEARIKKFENNIRSLRVILRRAVGRVTPCAPLTDSDIDRMLASCCTRQLLIDYQDKVVAGLTPHTDAFRTAVTTMHSTLGQARSVFRKNLLGVYEENKIKLPDLTGFLTWQPNYKQPSQEYQPIPDQLHQHLDTEARKLKSTDLNAYRAWLLVRYCGLRRAEAARASFEHIFAIKEPVAQPSEGRAPQVPEVTPPQFITRYRLRAGITKNGKPRLIPIEPSLYEELKSLAKVMPMPSEAPSDPAAPVDEPQSYILDGTWSDRYRHAFDRLAAWMKQNGWRRKKKAHEMRKQYGSEVAEQFGTRVGAKILGNSEKVFASNYDTILNLPDPKIYKVG